MSLARDVLAALQRSDTASRKMLQTIHAFFPLLILNPLQPMVLDFAETRITPGAHLLACCLWREGRGVANVRLLQKPLQQFRQRFGRKRRGMRGGRRSQPNHPGSGGSTKVQTSDFTPSSGGSDQAMSPLRTNVLAFSDTHPGVLSCPTWLFQAAPTAHATPMQHTEW